MVKDSQCVVIDDAPLGCHWTHADEVNRALPRFIVAAAPLEHRQLDRGWCLLMLGGERRVGPIGYGRCI